jgi:hypothetical protein
MPFCGTRIRRAMISMPLGSSNQYVSLPEDPRHDGLDALAAATTYTTTTTVGRPLIKFTLGRHPSVRLLLGRW